LRAVAALFIAVLLAVWFIVSILKGSDEIQARPEWSVLQNLEVRYRKNPTDRAVVIEKQPPYCAAGIVALDGHARVWILLDAKSKPLLKKLSDLNYRLSGSDLSEILRACPVSNDARIELQSHVADKM
jgi:hypothetical protein